MDDTDCPSMQVCMHVTHTSKQLTHSHNCSSFQTKMNESASKPSEYQADLVLQKASEPINAMVFEHQNNITDIVLNPTEFDVWFPGRSETPTSADRAQFDPFFVVPPAISTPDPALELKFPTPWSGQNDVKPACPTKNSDVGADDVHTLKRTDQHRDTPRPKSSPTSKRVPYHAAAAIRRYRATSHMKQCDNRSVGSAVTFKTPSPVRVRPVTSQDLLQFNEVENEMRAAVPITSEDQNAIFGIFGPPKRRRMFSGAAII